MLLPHVSKAICGPDVGHAIRGADVGHAATRQREAQEESMRRLEKVEPPPPAISSYPPHILSYAPEISSCLPPISSYRLPYPPTRLPFRPTRLLDRAHDMGPRLRRGLFHVINGALARGKGGIDTCKRGIQALKEREGEGGKLKAALEAKEKEQDGLAKDL
eukprot:38516-Rhodomonas_salina.1